jgi:hypothetical protein
MAVTIEQAQAAVRETKEVMERLAPVVFIGIARIGEDFGLKVNLLHEPVGDEKIPTSVNGVPVKVTVTGQVTAT